MKNNIKNKVLIILLIFLLLITTYSSVFASDTVTYVDRFGTERTYNDISSDINLEYGFLQKTIGVIFALDEGSYFYIRDGNSVRISGSVRVIGYHNGVWVDEGNHAYPDGYQVAVLNEVCYTTIDIYSDINKTSIVLEGSESFFPQPPATLEEIMLKEISQKATMQEILGILPVILSVLVSLIALRKGLKALVNGLRT